MPSFRRVSLSAFTLVAAIAVMIPAISGQANAQQEIGTLADSGTQSDTTVSRADEVDRHLERARRFGDARVITSAEIDLRHAVYVTDLLRSVPGIRVLRPGQVAQRGIALRRPAPTAGWSLEQPRVLGRANCDPVIFVNGRRRLEGSAHIDMLVMPSDLLGVEVYPGGLGTPAEYGVGCAIVLWTR